MNSHSRPVCVLGFSVVIILATSCSSDSTSDSGANAGAGGGAGASIGFSINFEQGPTSLFYLVLMLAEELGKSATARQEGIVFAASDR